MSDAASQETRTIRPRGGDRPVSEYEADLGLPKGFGSRILERGDAFASAVEFLANRRPKAQNHWPALSLAILAQAESLLLAEGRESVEDVFETFPPDDGGNGRVVNTMNLVSGDRSFKLRPSYNSALDVIRVEMRRDHPSNAAHATQSWRAYVPLITAVYQATPNERAAIAEYVWQEGVLLAPERRFASAASRIVRPFELALSSMPTQGFNPGGALFQGLVFGFFTADSPNLTLESHSVNTGSSRADMIGDVSGFRGGEVELAVEVKDHGIDDTHVNEVLGDFLEDLVKAPNATAVVVADNISENARNELAAVNVIGLSREDLRLRVITWDLPKQQEALRGAAYYLARIQKNTVLLQHLLDFVSANNLDAGLTKGPKATGAGEAPGIV